jgi:hypothetical protein
MSISIVRLALELSVANVVSPVSLAISQVSIVPNMRSSVFYYTSTEFYMSHLIFTALK